MNGDVSIECWAEDGFRLVLQISDTGIPFNILEVPEPDMTAEISERKVGGLGAFFVKEMADETRYRRDGDRNVLRLIFENHPQGAEGLGHAGDVQE